MLKKFAGFLQTDGNPVYDTYETGTHPNIQVAGCMAHARRKFVEVYDHFPKECRIVLEAFKSIYLNDAIHPGH